MTENEFIVKIKCKDNFLLRGKIEDALTKEFRKKKYGKAFDGFEILVRQKGQRDIRAEQLSSKILEMAQQVVNDSLFEHMRYEHE